LRLTFKISDARMFQDCLSADWIKNNMTKYKDIINKIFKGRELLNQLGFKLSFLALPLIFSLFSTFFEGITVAALIPFVKGIITRDFQFINEIGFVNKIINLFFPTLERSNAFIFIFILGVIFISAVLKYLFYYLSAISVSYQVRRATANLRNLIFEKYLNFGKMFFDRNNISQLQNILTHFSFSIGNEFSNLNLAVSQFCMLFLYIFAMFFISWQLTVFVVLILPIFDLAFRGLIQKIRRDSNLSANSSNKLVKNLFNVLSCISLVKIYNNEENEKIRFHENNLNLLQLEYSLDKKFNLIPVVQEIIFLIAILFLVAGMSFIYIKQKTGDLAAFMIYFYLLRRAQGAVGCFNRIKSTFGRIIGPLTSIRSIFDDKDKFFIPKGNLELVEFNKVIEFRKLNFRYDNDRQVLYDVSFTIEKGKIVAVVGETGSGKTTLANLLLRFYDCAAQSIFIDGIDIRSFNIKSLYKHFAYVSQESLLFNDTIRNNLIYGINRYVSDDELSIVIEKSRLSELKNSLREGLEAQVGDRGIKLSGGEKQRISIARALLKGSDILIFDEATSSLDSITEKLIQEAIDEAIQGRTVLVIAHRLSTIKNADKILVMDHGRIIEQGTLQQLLDKKGKFYSYWQEQKFLK